MEIDIPDVRLRCLHVGLEHEPRQIAYPDLHSNIYA